MNADVAFAIGSTHKICQDYAMCGLDPMPWVVVSDGCSSAPLTDFGARIIASSVQPYLSYDQPKDVFASCVLATANSRCAALGLPPAAICATLLCATLTEKEIKIRMVGDGVVVLIKQDGSLFINDIQFNSGAPFYLYYQLNERLRNSYFEQFGTIYSMTITHIDKNGIKTYKSNLSLPIEGMYCEELTFPLENHKGVALFSDGISTFFRTETKDTTKTNVHISAINIIEELLSFKGINGEFVQRRMNKAMQKFNDLGYKHADDLSMGVILT